MPCWSPGFFTRGALILGALSMVALSFGTALLGHWDILTQQLVYAVVYFFLSLASSTTR